MWQYNDQHGQQVGPIYSLTFLCAPGVIHLFKLFFSLCCIKETVKNRCSQTAANIWTASVEATHSINFILPDCFGGFFLVIYLSNLVGSVDKQNRQLCRSMENRISNEIKFNSKLAHHFDSLDIFSEKERHNEQERTVKNERACEFFHVIVNFCSMSALLIYKLTICF